MLESLKCEVIGVCWLSAYPSCVRWILCWLCIASSERLYWLREELCTPNCNYPKSSLEVSLCGKSCVDKLVKILLCEGGDVELCARTSKISVC